MTTPVIERIRKYFQIPDASIFMEFHKPHAKEIAHRKTMIWGLDESILRSLRKQQADGGDMSCPTA
ncbi:MULTISPECIES: hypothetical protein [unclassified Schlesneria]|uniref:hypothetical protein n=1 Tax=Schlesneria TaxID=656899 RepID=UPI002F0E1918